MGVNRLKMTRNESHLEIFFFVTGKAIYFENEQLSCDSPKKRDALPHATSR